MENYRNYLVFKVMKKSGRKTILERNLTRAEAQRIVKRDIEINPKADKYMICFREM